MKLQNNIPASISNTAGTFVCNHVFIWRQIFGAGKKYKSKNQALSIPHLPEQVIGKADTPSMSLDNILKRNNYCNRNNFSVEDDTKNQWKYSLKF